MGGCSGARKRAVAADGEMRLVLPAGAFVRRIFTIAGLDQLIPSFADLERAWNRNLPSLPAAVTAVAPQARMLPTPGLSRVEPDRHNRQPDAEVSCWLGGAWFIWGWLRQRAARRAPPPGSGRWG